MWLYLLYASIVTPTTKYLYAGEVTRQILLIHAHTYHSSRRHVCTRHIDRHNRKKKKEEKRYSSQPGPRIEKFMSRFFRSAGMNSGNIPEHVALRIDYIKCEGNYINQAQF